MKQRGIVIEILLNPAMRPYQVQAALGRRFWTDDSGLAEIPATLLDDDLSELPQVMAIYAMEGITTVGSPNELYVGQAGQTAVPEAQ